MQLALTDFFIVGLGFDLVGAWLLARGLIARPELVVMRSTSYWGTNYAAGFAAAGDRVDATFGVTSLLVGFTLQGVGYVLALAVGGDTSSSAGHALTALLLVVAAMLTTLQFWRATRRRRFCALLIEMAHWRAVSLTEQPVRDPVTLALPLVTWAFMLGEARAADDEDDVVYVKRVFGVSDARPEDS